MKKLFFTFLLAVICGLTSFGQRVTMTSGIYQDGVRGLAFKIIWQCGNGGNYNARIYFTDSEGYTIESNDENSDDDGAFCWTSRVLHADGNSTITTSCWIADRLLSRYLPKGNSYQAWCQIISGGRTIVECDPLSFSMN